MKTAFLVVGLFVTAVTAGAAPVIPIPAQLPSVHPRIEADPANTRAAIRQRLATDEAVRRAFEQLKAEVAAHVDRHRTDPTWLPSRLQMYWQSKATEVFIRGPFYDHAGGPAAPVPTVRYPGARDATTNYAAPTLEEMVPYAEDARGVYLRNRTTGQLEWTEPS
jgi:hypothetical protein